MKKGNRDLAMVAGAGAIGLLALAYYKKWPPLMQFLQQGQKPMGPPMVPPQMHPGAHPPGMPMGQQPPQRPPQPPAQPPIVVQQTPDTSGQLMQQMLAQNMLNQQLMQQQLGGIPPQMLSTVLPTTGFASPYGSAMLPSAYGQGLIPQQGIGRSFYADEGFAADPTMLRLCPSCVGVDTAWVDPNSDCGQCVAQVAARGLERAVALCPVCEQTGLKSQPCRDCMNALPRESWLGFYDDSGYSGVEPGTQQYWNIIGRSKSNPYGPYGRFPNGFYDEGFFCDESGWCGGGGGGSGMGGGRKKKKKGRDGGGQFGGGGFYDDGFYDDGWAEAYPVITPTSNINPQLQEAATSGSGGSIGYIGGKQVMWQPSFPGDYQPQPGFTLAPGTSVGFTPAWAGGGQQYGGIYGNILQSGAGISPFGYGFGGISPWGFGGLGGTMGGQSFGLGGLGGWGLPGYSTDPLSLMSGGAYPSNLSALQYIIPQYGGSDFYPGLVDNPFQAYTRHDLWNPWSPPFGGQPTTPYGVGGNPFGYGPLTTTTPPATVIGPGIPVGGQAQPYIGYYVEQQQHGGGHVTGGTGNHPSGSGGHPSSGAGGGSIHPGTEGHGGRGHFGGHFGGGRGWGGHHGGWGGHHWRFPYWGGGPYYPYPYYGSLGLGGGISPLALELQELELASALSRPRVSPYLGASAIPYGFGDEGGGGFGDDSGGYAGGDMMMGGYGDPSGFDSGIMQ